MGVPSHLSVVEKAAPGIDIGIVAPVFPQSVAPESISNFSYQMTNNSATDVDVFEVKVTTVNATVTAIAVDASATACSLSSSSPPAATSASCSISPLPAGESRTLILTVVASSEASFDSYVEIFSEQADPAPEDNFFATNIEISSDADADADGIPEVDDSFPGDSSETTDTDNDGVADSDDAFPQDASEWADTDGDGVGDNADAFSLDPTVQKIESRLPMSLLKAAKDKQAEQQAD